MPQSLTNVLVHVVFSTKERRALLQNPDLRTDMHSYLAGICANLKCPAIIVGGATDHVHLLFDQSRNATLADLVKEVKRSSSLWAKTKSPQWNLFQWQSGYSAFSVSQSQKNRVRVYIETQEEHHRKLSFQDEFRLLLKRHGVTFDEKHACD